MRRREFIALVGGTAVGWPLAARAQQPDRKRLIGVLMGALDSDAAAQSRFAAFRGALAKLGWTEMAIFGSSFAGAPMPRS